jgi:hypothetical protein
LPKVDTIGVDSKGDIDAVVDEKRNIVFVANGF